MNEQAEEAGEYTVKKKPTRADDEALIARALADFKVCQDHDDDDYKQGEVDNDFLQGDPWDPAIKKMRMDAGRPCLNIPRLQPFVHQVENEQRQSRPSITVNPVDDKADPETAKIIKGIIRNIETTSAADTVYDLGGSNAIRMGRGWIRVNTRFADERSFDQEIELLGIFNPFSAYIDPSHKRQDGLDSNFAILFEDVPRAQFKRLWPKADPVSLDLYSKTQWCTENTVRIAEYFYKDFVETTLYRLPGFPEADETVMTAEEAQERGIDVSGIPEEDRRQTSLPTIKWCKITAAEVLERTDWPGKYIPLVPVYGDLIWFQGKRRSRALIHHAKDSQKFLNYMRSASAEVIGLQPKSPFVGIKGSFRSFLSKWKRANIDNEAFLEYDPVFVTDPVSKQAVLAPPPQRQPPPQGSIALMQEGQAASDDIKAALGMFAPSLGQEGDEKSGKAIVARQQQGNNATFHFMDNRAVAIAGVGTILVDLIPRVYSRPQRMRIIGDDNQPRNVRINEQFTDPQTGKPVLYDLTAGKYDVVVSVGPAMATKRIETVNTLIELVRANPAIAPLTMDVLFQNLDIAEAQELSQRIKATMPPELQGDDPSAQKLKMAGQAIEALKSQIEQLVGQLKDKSANENLDREVKMRELELKDKELSLKQTEAATRADATRAETTGQRIDNAGAVRDVLPENFVPALMETLKEMEDKIHDVGQAVSMILDHDPEIPPEGDEGTPAPVQAGA